VTKNGDLIKGTFSKNWPNGETEIQFANGDLYQGEVVRGVMTGNGFLQCSNKDSFRGEFKDGKLNGSGCFFVEGGTFQLSGNYTDGVPDRETTNYVLSVTSPCEEAEDPKAKKDPKKAAPVADEVEGQGHPHKVVIDVCKEEEDKKTLGLCLTVVFQGPDYEEEVPEDDDPKKKKTKGDNDEPEMRSVTPDPITMENEDGREFEVELGRME